MQTKNKKRIFYLDALRALAIFGVVLCHMADPALKNMALLNAFPSKYMLLLFLDCFRDFAVPLFVMISGALLINKHYGLSVFIKKKFNRIFVPFIFWDIILILFAVLSFYLLGNKVTAYSSFSTDFFISAIFGVGKYGGYLWFIWMILIVYIVLFIVNLIIKRFNHIPEFDLKLVKVLVGCFIVFSILFSLGFFKTGDRIISDLYYLGYAFLGYYLFKADFTKFKFLNKKTLLIATFILSIALYLFITYINFTRVVTAGRFVHMNQFEILMVILNICIFLFFRYFEEYNGKITRSIFNKIKNGISGKLILSLSACSFGIYLSHIIIRNMYQTYIFKWIGFNIKSIGSVYQVVFMTVLVLCTCWLIIWAMSKIPYLKKVSGA